MKLLSKVFLFLWLTTTLHATPEEDEYYDDVLNADEEDDSALEEDYFALFDNPDDKDEYWVPEEEWHNHWPPKRSDGRPIPLNDEGVKEWEIIAEKAKLRYKELEDMYKFSQDDKPRPYPFCVDGKLPKAFGVGADNDPNLDNFRALFTLSQPRNGVPVISDRFGKTNIVHMEDGIDNGPYIQFIRFLRLSTPPAPKGNGVLPSWAHIYIKSRVPLEGLFIQAIGHPNGLPFGWFNNFFDCDLSDIDIPGPHPPTTSWGVRGLKWDNYDRRNIHVPCKYGHGEGHGASIPTVFAYGGHLLGEVNEKPTNDTFRTQFSWTSQHCGYIFRVQFIILAVKSFLNLEYETFLTPNYILPLVHKDGVPAPISFEWRRSQNGRMTCNSDLLETVQEDSKIVAAAARMAFTFSKSSSDFPLKYNEAYENCIRDGKDLDPVTLVCPPQRTCLSSLHPYERTQDGSEQNIPKKNLNFDTRNVQKFFDSHKTQALQDCRPVVCREPWKTQPKLRKSYDDSAGAKTRFSPEFSQALYGNMTQLSRSHQATHGWTMILSWFILMGIATFTSRFMKEAGAINRDLENGCLGFGIWIWVHMLLMVFAITFMWIGILDSASLRRRPVPCNFLEIYSEEPDLKELCRGRKKSVRRHKKIAITAVALFHLSLIFAWTRPLIVKKLKRFTFNFRKIFLWSHILLAYFSKLIAVLSVVPFLLPEGAQVCNDLPIWIFIIEVSSICVFVGATVWQILEDRMLRINRSHFPMLTAYEPGEVGSLDYWIKVGITIGSCVLHLLLFGGVLMSVIFVYYTTDEKNAKLTGTFEVIKGIFGSCKITSTASEVEMSMQRYYYSRQSREA